MTYEAGPTGFGLARFLRGHGVGCVVAAPSKAMTRKELTEQYQPYVRSIAGKIKTVREKKNRLYVCGTTSLYAVLTCVNGALVP